MLVRVPRHVEAIAVGKDVLVAVRGWVPDRHLLALADPLSPDLGVLAGGAAEVVDRRGEAEDLLDRGLEQRRAAQHLLGLIGVRDQRVHAPAGDRAGRLVAGDREQQEKGGELQLRQLVSVDLAGEQAGDEIVAGPGKSLGRQLHGVPEHLAPISCGTPIISQITCSGSSAARSSTNSSTGARLAVRLRFPPARR